MLRWTVTRIILRSLGNLVDFFFLYCAAWAFDQIGDGAQAVRDWMKACRQTLMQTIHRRALSGAWPLPTTNRRLARVLAKQGRLAESCTLIGRRTPMAKVILADLLLASGR